MKNREFSEISERQQFAKSLFDRFSDQKRESHRKTNHTNKRDRSQVGSADLPRSPLSYGNMERTFSYAGRIPAFMMLRMRPLLEFREKRTALNGLITENFFTEHAELVRAVPVLPDQLFHPARCCADVSSWCLVLRRQM